MHRVPLPASRIPTHITNLLAPAVTVLTRTPAENSTPLEYVKICTLYGAGFYYLPGTDICVKHGAYVRSQWYFGAGSAPTNGPFLGASGQQAEFNAVGGLGTPNYTVHRTRAVYTLDARTQTEYGTL